MVYVCYGNQAWWCGLWREIRFQVVSEKEWKRPCWLWPKKKQQWRYFQMEGSRFQFKEREKKNPEMSLNQYAGPEWGLMNSDFLFNRCFEGDVNSYHRAGRVTQSSVLRCLARARRKLWNRSSREVWCSVWLGKPAGKSTISVGDRAMEKFNVCILSTSIPLE